MRDVDATVLGKIILLQSTLHIMQENDGLARFVCRGLEDVPGVGAVGMILNGSFHSNMDASGVDAASCSLLFDSLAWKDQAKNQDDPDKPLLEFAKAHGLECLKIETIFDLYGLLFLKLTDKTRFSPYRPYLENTLNLIGLIVENNRQRALLLQNKADLEKAVEERTRELKASQEQLSRARKMEAIGTLSGGIAHEINNILSVIIGNSEMAQQEVPEESEAGRFLHQVVAAGLRARDVVRRLLMFSRGVREAKKPLNLSPLVEDVLQEIRLGLPAGVDISWSLSDSLPYVDADADQMRLMLRNLCGNAIDAMADAGGRIEVDLESVVLAQEAVAFDPALSPGEFVRLTVRDEGPGVLPEDADRIFDPYYTTKEVGKGTGMGLSVVYGIVKGHCGGIRARNRNGCGAAFEALLPVSDS